MNVNYIGGVGVIDSYAQLVGTGTVEVFSNGRVEHGTWSRANLRHRAVYKNLEGKVINLTPGQTFVELLSVGEGVSITRVEVRRPAETCFTKGNHVPHSSPRIPSRAERGERNARATPSTRVRHAEFEVVLPRTRVDTSSRERRR